MKSCKSTLLTFTVLLTLFLLIGHVRCTHPHFGQGCKSDSECLSDGWEFCQIEKAKTTNNDGGAKPQLLVGVCKHKDVYPLKELEFWGFMAVLAILWQTNVGGIGGGGIVMPICMIFFKFDAKNSIALSNFSIFLSSFMRWIINSQQPHPLKNGKGILVDMNLAILMLPLIVSGVSIGVILNILLPEIIIICSYLLALCYFGRGISMKAIALYKKEVARDKQVEIEMQAKEGGGQGGQSNEEQAAKEGGGQINEEQNQNDGGDQEGEVINRSGDYKDKSPETKTDAKNEKLEAIIAYESTNLQWSKVALNWGLIVILVIISLLKGADNKDSSALGILRCDPIDWVLFAILQIVCLIFLIIGIYVLKKDLKEKTEAGYNFIQGDLEATPKNLAIMITISFFGSIFASFSGLGPGMLFCPTLIMIGIESRVATATGMYVTMFLTLSATIQMIIFKKINMSYAVYVLIMTAIGSVLGLFFQRYIVKTFNRVSYTNFFFVAGIVIAILSTTIVNIPILIHKADLGESILATSDYCPASE